MSSISGREDEARAEAEADEEDDEEEDDERGMRDVI